MHWLVTIATRTTESHPPCPPACPSRSGGASRSALGRPLYLRAACPPALPEVPRHERGLHFFGRAVASPTLARFKVTLMPKDVILTPDGLEKLKSELEYLSTEKRREVAARIKEAREFGDISENAEYDDAKNEQALLEARIAQLEEKLRRAQVIDEKSLNTDEVGFGSIVHVKD